MRMFACLLLPAHTCHVMTSRSLPSSTDWTPVGLTAGIDGYVLQVSRDGGLGSLTPTSLSARTRNENLLFGFKLQAYIEFHTLTLGVSIRIADKTVWLTWRGIAWRWEGCPRQPYTNAVCPGPFRIAAHSPWLESFFPYQVPIWVELTRYCRSLPI